MHHKKHDDSDELALMALRAGLGYGPAKAPKTFMDAILAEQRHTTLVNIAIPTVLHQYFKIESKRLGLTEEELMVRILETHRFADQQQQHLTLAISRRNR